MLQKFFHNAETTPQSCLNYIWRDLKEAFSQPLQLAMDKKNYKNKQKNTVNHLFIYCMSICVE